MNIPITPSGYRFYIEFRDHSSPHEYYRFSLTWGLIVPPWRECLREPDEGRLLGLSVLNKRGEERP